MCSQRQGLGREKLGYDRHTSPLDKMRSFYLRLPNDFFSFCVSGPLSIGPKPIFIHIKSNRDILDAAVFFTKQRDGDMNP